MEARRGCGHVVRSRQRAPSRRRGWTGHEGQVLRRRADADEVALQVIPGVEGAELTGDTVATSTRLVHPRKRLQLDHSWPGGSASAAQPANHDLHLGRSLSVGQCGVAKKHCEGMTMASATGSAMLVAV